MISQPEKTSSSLTLTAKYCIKGVHTVSCVSCNRVSVTIYIHYYSETKKVKRADWHKNQNNSVDWIKISKSVDQNYTYRSKYFGHSSKQQIVIIILPITVDY